MPPRKGLVCVVELHIQTVRGAGGGGGELLLGVEFEGFGQVLCFFQAGQEWGSLSRLGRGKWGVWLWILKGGVFMEHAVRREAPFLAGDPQSAWA